MKTTWKDSFYLARLEFRTQLGYVVLGWFVVLIVGGLFLSSFYNYLHNNHPTFDLMFVAYFFAFPYWMRSRQIVFQKVNDQLHASPFVLLLAQLPVNKMIIVRSRIIAYYLFLLPIISTTFLILFAFDFRLYNVFNFVTYVVFFIAWISVSAWFGLALVAIEVGTKQYIWQSMVGLLLVAIIFVFHYYVQTGLVAWTAHVAHVYPLQTLGAAILIFLFGTYFWTRVMEKRCTEVDYF